MVQQKQENMSSRASILEAIRQSNASSGSLESMPDMKDLQQNEDKKETLLNAFIRSARLQGADVSFAKDIPEPAKWLKNLYPEADHILSAVNENGFPPGNRIQSGRPDFRQVDLSIIRGAFGVAENGSVWVPESSLPVRVLPFICTHLIILLNRANLVAHMHEAYRRALLPEIPFGVFIAGPSKTADIEQSLVIGAQGPKSVMILLDGLSA